MPKSILQKSCSLCKQIKPISEFSVRRDRKTPYTSWCKSCVSKRMKSYYLKNAQQMRNRKVEYNRRHREQIRLYDRSDHRRRLSLRNYYARIDRIKAHRERTKAQRRAYQREYSKRPHVRERERVRKALIDAVRAGKIERPKCCSECGNVGQVEGHHYKGYAWEHRFIVDWICQKCHKSKHRKFSLS